MLCITGTSVSGTFYFAVNPTCPTLAACATPPPTAIEQVLAGVPGPKPVTRSGSGSELLGRFTSTLVTTPGLPFTDVTSGFTIRR